MRRHVTDSQDWKIQILARYGFSYRYICERVLKNTDEINVIGRVLRQHKLRVRDYRDGLTPEGRNMARSVLKR